MMLRTALTVRVVPRFVLPRNSLGTRLPQYLPPSRKSAGREPGGNQKGLPAQPQSRSSLASQFAQFCVFLADDWT
jgi:hypothetical protein